MSKRQSIKTQAERNELKKQIQDNQALIKSDGLKTRNLTPPRTRQTNAKFPAKNIEEENQRRDDILSSQIGFRSKRLPKFFLCLQK